MVDVVHPLPEPAAQGTLAKTPFSHLLIYAYERQLSGTFEFAGPAGDGGTVLVIDGQPTKAKTIQATSYLGRVLLELGLLTDEQLDTSLRALAIQKRLHGQILMEAGVLNEEQLELGLRSQLVRKMQALVRLPPEATFCYYDAFDALASYGGDGQHVGIDPYPIVWAAIREEPPWEHVRGVLAKIGSAGVRLTEEAETARFSFDKGERATVELLRTQCCAAGMRLQELTAAEDAPAAPGAAFLVYCLMLTKQVQLVTELALAALAPARAGVVLASVRKQQRRRGTCAAAVVATPTSDRPSALAQSGRARPSSRSARIAMESARCGRRSESRRVAARQEAQPVVALLRLWSATRSVHARAGRARASGDAAQAMSCRRELSARRKDIRERAAKIDRGLHFAMLGVLDRDCASPQAVQAAFFALAKTWHPDRLPAAIA